MNRGILKYRLPLDRMIKKGWYCVNANRAVKRLAEVKGIDAVLFYNMALYPVTNLQRAISIYDLGDDHIELLRHEMGKLENRLILSLARLILRKTLQKADVVFSASHYLKEKYSPNSVVLPNGVSMEAVKHGSGAALRQRYPGPIVGFVGSLEYFIPFEQILEAAERMRECTFVIAGGGREYEWLLREKLGRNLANLILTGGLPHAEILRYIDSFDICLNLFRKNPLTDGACPIKLFEYMAHKKAIISSRVREVEKIDQGFLYWADNTDEVVRSIRDILVNQELARVKGEKAFRVVVENYTWQRIADRFLETIEQSRLSGNADR